MNGDFIEDQNIAQCKYRNLYMWSVSNYDTYQCQTYKYSPKELMIACDACMVLLGIDVENGKLLQRILVLLELASQMAPDAQTSQEFTWTSVSDT